MTEFTKPSALVTGATGFIGGRLAARLVEDGWSVRLLVRDSNKLISALRSKADVQVGNLADVGSLCRAVRGMTVVFHCAANVKTWDNWEAYYAANVVGVQNLLYAITSENPGLARLVHLSTVDVYGFPLQPCDEHCQPAKSGFSYGDSKLIGETLVRESSSTSHIPYTIIRPANVIGPGSQFIERIGHALKSGIMLTIDGGRANAGFIYVDNLIDYLLWAAQSPNAIGQFYNARDDYDVTWSQFLALFRKALHGRGLIIDLSFDRADVLARLFEGFNRVFLPSREPLLHRLLVRLFGRTCGHGAGKIRADGAGKERVGFDEAMEKSVQWFVEGFSSK